jgi:hypothetical protein
VYESQKLIYNPLFNNLAAHLEAYMSLAKSLEGMVGVKENFKGGGFKIFFENFTADLR